MMFCELKCVCVFGKESKDMQPQIPDKPPIM